MENTNRTYRFIVNPIAGRGAGALALPEIESFAHSHNIAFDIIQTERPGHAIELARDAVAAERNVVVAVGGDGTANEVLNGLMLARHAGLTGTTMGLLSIGRGNDFAYWMGIPQGLEAGLQTLLQNSIREVDVGRVTGGLYPNGRYFGNGVGIGFDAVVGFEALKLKRLHGFVNCLVAALKTIFLYFHAPRMHIQIDGETIIQPSLMVSIMNGRRMGGGFMMAPTASPEDGLFDLCIAGQVSRLGILGLIPRFMKGTQATHPAIKTRQSRAVHVVTLEGVLPAHADGETLCTEGRELTIELLPGQLEIISQSAKTL